MSRQRSRSVKYYCCPVCGKNSTDRIAIEKHYRERHPVKIDEVIYCNICGAGGTSTHTATAEPGNGRPPVIKAILTTETWTKRPEGPFSCLAVRLAM